MDEDATAVIKEHEGIILENSVFDEFIAACDKAQEPNQALLDTAKLARESDIK